MIVRGRSATIARIVRSAGTARDVMTGHGARIVPAVTIVPAATIGPAVTIGPGMIPARVGMTGPAGTIERAVMIARGIRTVLAVMVGRSVMTVRGVMTGESIDPARKRVPIVRSSLTSRRASPDASSIGTRARNCSA